jgi:hypothetical protein
MDPVGQLFMVLSFALLAAAIIIPQLQRQQDDKKQ